MRRFDRVSRTQPCDRSTVLNRPVCAAGSPGRATSVESEFADDRSLLGTTIGCVVEAHLRRERALADLLATGDFQRWARTALLQSRTPGPIFGCEIGCLTRQPDVVGADRDLLDRAYCEWQGQLATALQRLQRRGLLGGDADVPRLATTMLSLIEGAYLTACRTRDLTAIEATFAAAARLVTHPPAWPAGSADTTEVGLTAQKKPS
jgi:hypothetical protein